MIRRILVAILTSLLLIVSNETCFVQGTCFVQEAVAYAEEIEYTEENSEHDIIYYQYDDGIPVREGGINSIDGVKAETEEETIQLEKDIRSQNYILVTTDDKDISDEEFEKFAMGNYKPPYYQYFNKDNEYYWTKYKVYIYKPCYDEVMKQLEEKKNVSVLTDGEVATSTVVIDYSCWYEKERAGKILNEYNDNIPEWYTETGYLKITTSMEVDVTLELVYESTLYKFRISPDEPFLVRLKAGEYNVKILNTTEVSETEKSLPYANTIQVQPENTEDNPYKLDLTEAIQALDVTPLAPNEPFDDGIEDDTYSLSEERVETAEQEKLQDSTKKGHILWTIIFISIGVIAVLVFIIIIILARKKYSNE